MKQVKKLRKILINGKVEKTEPVTERVTRIADPEPIIKRIMDSTAQSLILQGERDLASAKESKSNTEVLVWEEVKEEKKTSSKKSDSK